MTDGARALGQAAATAGAASERHAEPRYTIGELAAEFGLTPRTIRFYEDGGLLAPERAGPNRVYGHRDRARLVLICRAKRLGFSLAEVKEYLDLYEVDEDQAGQMRFGLTIARERIRALEAQLHDLEQTLDELRALEAGFAEGLRRAGIEPG